MKKSQWNCSQESIENGLSKDEIQACEKDPNKEINILKTNIPQPKPKTKGASILHYQNVLTNQMALPGC